MREVPKLALAGPGARFKAGWLLAPALNPNIGDFGAHLYSNYKKEPPKLVIIGPP